MSEEMKKMIAAYQKQQMIFRKLGEESTALIANGTYVDSNHPLHLQMDIANTEMNEIARFFIEEFIKGETT